MSYKGHLSYSIVERSKVRHRALHHQFPGMVPELLRVGVTLTGTPPPVIRGDSWDPASAGAAAVYLPCKYGQVPAWIVVRRPSGVQRNGAHVVSTEIVVAVPGDAQCMFLWRYWNDNQFEFLNNFAQAMQGR
jgi:hypothetical protein